MGEVKKKTTGTYPSNVLDSLQSKDFQGTTAFSTLSAEERIEWLAKAAEFALKARQAVRG